MGSHQALILAQTLFWAGLLLALAAVVIWAVDRLTR